MDAQQGDHTKFPLKGDIRGVVPHLEDKNNLLNSNRYSISIGVKGIVIMSKPTHPIDTIK